MDNGTATTLFEPTELNLNIDSQQEDDEEAIEDQKKRDEELKVQLENAFDDWSDEDEGRERDQTQSSCSSQEDVTHYNRKHLDCNVETTNGMIFHSLGKVSERSSNKNKPCLLNISEESGAGDSVKVSGDMFSPSRNTFSKANGSTPNLKEVMGGRGDADSYQMLFTNNHQNHGQFLPTFLSDENFENSNSGHEEAYKKADYNSIEQLQVLYSVRLNEIQQLSSQLEIERRNAATQKEEASRKLALLEAEKERAMLSRNEANKLLVANKEELSEFQKEITSLKQIVAALEKEKTKSEEMVEFSKIQIEDLEQRIAMMERCDPNKTFVKKTDIMIRELRSKHHQEIYSMQRQTDLLTKRLTKKEEECVLLEQKVLQLQKSHEALLVDKSDTINQLARSLEESQSQCRQLMASNVSCENVRLQNQLEDALKEKEKLSLTVKNLQVDCNMMRSDLAQYESVSRLTLTHSSSSDETDSIIQMGMSNRQASKNNSSHNLNHSDITSKLKNELNRALLNQKARRAEIERLQETVSTLENELENMKKQERIYLAQEENYKGEIKSKLEELHVLQEHLKANSSLTNKVGENTEEVSCLRAELADLRKEKAVLERSKLELQRKIDDLTKFCEQNKQTEIADYNKEYFKFHDETVAKVRKEVEEEAELKIKEYSVRLDQSLREINELKELYVFVCTAKEQLTQGLNDANALLQQVTAQNDKLSTELKESNTLRDQMARRLNETAGTRKDDITKQRLEEERNQLQEDVNRYVEMKDQLVKRVNMLKTENEELIAEVQRLKEFINSSPRTVENHLSLECERLRSELSAMSARHTLELSAARAELQGARDRVVQLEKSTRLQYEPMIKSLQQDCDLLKTKCDEKEVQIKKLIESRKRPPAMAVSSTQTDLAVEDGMMDLQRLEERHYLELMRCKEENSKTLAEIEEAHHKALLAANEKHQQILEMIKEQVGQEVDALKASHKQELAAVEERTKQLTVKVFAEELKKLESRFIQDTNGRIDPSVLESLHKALLEKTKEIESLKQKLATTIEESRLQMATLKDQMESERNKVSQLMFQWTIELQNAQGELKLKETIIDDQGVKLQKAKNIAKKYRNKLIKTNQEINTQYLNKCAEYKEQMQKNIEESKKEVFDQINQMQKYYEEREKKIRRNKENKIK